tara:strand:- start:302 stop:1111 length:810 start_codon:yes stop_codon:yes gene_type:complete
MIDRKLILANAPSNMGQQVHINHVGCTSGEDKKKRLYIKRTDRGLVAYCHHCNEAGFAGDDNSRMGTWLKAKDPTNPRHTAVPVLSDLTIEGKMWLAKYYCDTNAALFSGVKNSPKQVAMVLLDATTAHIGIQVRNLLPITPKYITSYHSDTRKGEAAWFYYGSKTLVITEDYLSAYRTHLDGGVSAVALLRTALSDTTLRQIADLEFEHIFIWLDPDQAGIEGARKVKQKLRHYLPISTSVHVMHKDKEPKQHTKKELSGLFHSASLL